MSTSTNVQQSVENDRRLAHLLAVLTIILFVILIYLVNRQLSEQSLATMQRQPVQISMQFDESSQEIVALSSATPTATPTHSGYSVDDAQHTAGNSAVDVTNGGVGKVKVAYASGGDEVTPSQIMQPALPTQADAVLIDTLDDEQTHLTNRVALVSTPTLVFVNDPQAQVVEETIQIIETPSIEPETQAVTATAVVINLEEIETEPEIVAEQEIETEPEIVAEQEIETESGILTATTLSESQIQLSWQLDFDQMLTTPGENSAQLAWFYKPPKDGNLAALLENFDYFILTRGDESARDLLTSAGKKNVLQYLRFDAIHDPCWQALKPVGTPCTCNKSVWRNNVAWNSDDICMIRDQHPDWFLRNTNGDPIMGSDNFVFMDPGNQGWREFWLQRTRVAQEQMGWHGVFLDNMEGSMRKFDPAVANSRHPEGLQNYPDDASFQQAWQGFAQYIYTGYFQPTGRPLLANIVHSRGENTWQNYLAYLDGAMDEGWGVDWGNGYLSRSRWEKSLQYVEQSAAAGKQFVLVAQGSRSDTHRQGFAFASYLLISSDNVAFRYTDAANYTSVWVYDNYNIELGQPLGKRYKVGDFWQRDFAGGTVRVNPDNQEWDIVPGTNELLSLQLEVSDDNGATFTVVNDISVSETLYLHAALHPETTYCYRLRFVTTLPSERLSNVACADTLLVQPAPVMMSASVRSADQFNFEGDTIFLPLADLYPLDGAVYTVDGLPQGLWLDRDNGIIMGVLDAGTSNGSPYLISLAVQNNEGLIADVSFNWYVQLPTPTPTLTYTATATTIPTLAATATPEIFPTATYTMTSVPTETEEILLTEAMETQVDTPTPELIAVSPEPQATQTPVIITYPEGAKDWNCPVGTRMMLWDAPTKLNSMESHHQTTDFELSEASQGGGLLVVSGIGHTENKCTDNGSCDEIQMSASFNIRVNDTQLLNPDDPKNPSVFDLNGHQWETNFFPVDLERGYHDVSLIYVETADDVNNVWFRAAFCFVPAKPDESIVTEEVNQEIVVDGGILPTATTMPETVEPTQEATIEIEDGILPTATPMPQVIEEGGMVQPTVVTNEVVQPDILATAELIPTQIPDVSEEVVVQPTQEMVVEEPTIETVIESATVSPTEVPVQPTATPMPQVIEEGGMVQPTEIIIVEEPTTMPPTPQPTEPPVEAESGEEVSEPSETEAEVDAPKEQSPVETP